MSAAANPKVPAGRAHAHADHFSSTEHEFESSKFGMWLFLITELMLFGGLFVAYIVFRSLYPEMFEEAHLHLDRVMGAINTVVLICSSLTMALAVGMAQRGEQRKSAALLVATIGMAFVFLIIKYFEYSHKFHEGLLPGANFTNQAITHEKAELFFSLYFMMTGLHGVHVIGGIAVMVWVLLRTLRKEFNPTYYTPVEITGLYWHFVDLVWIYLFPLFYLIG